MPESWGFTAGPSEREEPYSTVQSMDGYGWRHCFAICRETPNFTTKQLIHHPAQHRISQDNGQTEEPEWATLLLVSVSVSSFFTPLASDPSPQTRDWKSWRLLHTLP